jgi:hypothetical protein
MYYLGLDLGQSQDPTALCVVEKVRPELNPEAEAELKHQYKAHTRGPLARIESDFSKFMKYNAPTEHQLRHLERVDLGTTYPAIVDKLVAMVTAEPLVGKYQIIADATGCGRPVIDLMQKAKLNVIPVMITGGHQVNFSEGYYNVPKRELVSNLQVLLGNHRLKFAGQIPDRDMLIAELQAFSLTINEKAHDVYEGRQGVHDDEVLAIALAAWYSETYGHVWEAQHHNVPNPYTGRTTL